MRAGPSCGFGPLLRAFKVCAYRRGSIELIRLYLKITYYFKFVKSGARRDTRSYIADANS